MQVDEEIGGRSLFVNKLTDLNDYMAHCGLTDLTSLGPSWSWHNNTEGDAWTFGKLDRALCNDNWLDQLSDEYVEYMSTSSSDHTPTLLHISHSNSDSKPFRYFNWAPCQGFTYVIIDTWLTDEQGSRSTNWSANCKALKEDLKKNGVLKIMITPEKLLLRCQII